MIDRKKVIKGLECCMSEQICKGCPYKETDECEDRGYYYSKAIEDAIALLKEQEEQEQKEYKEEHPCEFCQEYLCDGCPYDDR